MSVNRSDTFVHQVEEVFLFERNFRESISKFVQVLTDPELISLLSKEDKALLNELMIPYQAILTSNPLGDVIKTTDGSVDVDASLIKIATVINPNNEEFNDLVFELGVAAKNYNQAFLVLAERLGTNNPLADEKIRAGLGPQGMGPFAIKPVQHVPRYRLLQETLLKVLKDENSEAATGIKKSHAFMIDKLQKYNALPEKDEFKLYLENMINQVIKFTDNKLVSNELIAFEHTLKDANKILYDEKMNAQSKLNILQQLKDQLAAVRKNKPLYKALAAHDDTFQAVHKQLRVARRKRKYELKGSNLHKIEGLYLVLEAACEKYIQRQFGQFGKSVSGPLHHFHREVLEGLQRIKNPNLKDSERVEMLANFLRQVEDEPSFKSVREMLSSQLKDVNKQARALAGKLGVKLKDRPFIADVLDQYNVMTAIYGKLIQAEAQAGNKTSQATASVSHEPGSIEDLTAKFAIAKQKLDAAKTALKKEQGKLLFKSKTRIERLEEQLDEANKNALDLSNQIAAERKKLGPVSALVAAEKVTAESVGMKSPTMSAMEIERMQMLQEAKTWYVLMTGDFMTAGNKIAEQMKVVQEGNAEDPNLKRLQADHTRLLEFKGMNDRAMIVKLQQMVEKLESHVKNVAPELRKQVEKDLAPVKEFIQNQLKQLPKDQEQQGQTREVHQ